MISRSFDKGFHAHGTDGVEEVVDDDAGWGGRAATAGFGRARAEAALGAATMADAAEVGGRILGIAGGGGV